MIWIFCISFAVLTSTTQSLKTRWKLGPDLASSAELAPIDSNLKTAKNTGIDMDYFGGSSERMSQRTSEEISAGRSEIEPPQIKSVDRGNPMIVYVVDPDVLENRQESLMKVRSVKSSSSESDGVTYEDLLKFLMQVGARIKEQKGTNPLFDHPNLIDLIRNTRRRRDDDIYETDKAEPVSVKSESFSNEKELKPRSRPPIRKKELSIEKFVPKESGRNRFVSREEPSPTKTKKRRERISMEVSPRPQKKKRGNLSIEKFDPKESGRNRFVSREEPPTRMKKRRERISMEEPPRPQKKKRGNLSIEKFDPKESGRNRYVSREEPPTRIKKRMERISMEEPPRPQKKKRGNNIARIPKYSYEPLGLKDLFRTPKPFIGKVGIYEDK